MTSHAVSSNAAAGRMRREESAAFSRRLRVAAGVALGLHLLLTFAIPPSQLPISPLEFQEPEGTQVELVGSIPETAPAAPAAEPPPPQPAPKPEPPPPPPKPDPETISIPEPPPKPVEQRPPPPPPPAPKPKPQPAAEKKPSPSASSAPRTGSATASTQGAASGAPGGADGKSTRPGYLEKAAPKYPPESQAAREHGTVILSVEINAAGRPESLKVEKSSGYPRLDRAAVEAVRQWRFKPATREGQAVPARVNIPVLFKLP